MSQLRMAEFNYDKESLQEEVEEMLPMANPNQKDIFDEVMTAIEDDSPIAKAFLYKVLVVVAKHLPSTFC